MKFVAIKHEDMTAEIKIREPVRSAIAVEEKWKGRKDVRPLKPKQIPKYNPSIVLLKKNKDFCTYIMAYRASYPTKGPKKRMTKPRLPPYNWTLWDTQWATQFDGVGFCKLKIFNSGKTTIKNEFIPARETSGIMDARLVKWKDGLYLIYNRYAWQQPHPNSNTELEKCANLYCITMFMRPVKVFKDRIKLTGPPRLLCRDKHQQFEKNWSLVVPFKRKRLLHYSFLPHKFLSSGMTRDPNADRCEFISPARSDFFMKLHKYYKYLFFEPEANPVAVTTPLVEFDSKHYIGVGRIKVSFLDFKMSRRDKITKCARELGKRLGLKGVNPKEWWRNDYVHPGSLLYFQFFYTVKKGSLELGNFSACMLPQCKDVPYFSTVTFPVAIQPFTRGKFAISTGISDIDCGIMIATRKELRDMMIYNNNSKPSSYDFIIKDF